MPTHLLRPIFARDLRTLDHEIAAYPDDATVWQEVQGLPNPAGTLVLHLVGNLNHYVGAVLGDTDYVRDREAEFSARGVPRHELSRAVTSTAAVVEGVLMTLPPERFDDPFPARFRGVTLRTGTALIHLATHLAFHVGQIDYHRRVVTGDPKSVAAMLPGTLEVLQSAGERAETR